MKAFLPAAGVGSRLRPLTDDLPKALIPVGGMPMIERALLRLKNAGVDSFVVNAHHHAQKVADFCSELSRRHGVAISVSREDDLLLDTGGGLKKAAPLLAGNEPFFVHNADVLTDLDLGALRRAHRESGALATLACRQRESARLLLFDRTGLLRGRQADGRVEWSSSSVPDAERLAFDGVSIMSPDFLPLMSEEGVFSLTRPWLRLAGQGRAIRAFRSDRWAWHDVGTPEKLAEAERRAAHFPAPDA